jgi:predicted cobalt transporter CbtA
MLAGADPALDRQVILFQNIIEVLHRSMPAILLQSLLGFEPHDGQWITGVLFGLDDPPRRMFLSAEGLARKRSAAAASRLADRRKSMVAPVELTAGYK